VASVALDDGEAEPAADLCVAVMNPTEESADPLASAGLRGLGVSSRLVREFPPRGLNCAGTVAPSESRVRGVFVELGDGTGGTAGVYAAIHPRDKSSDWRAYLRDMFGGDLDFHQRGDGSILAVIRGHPRSAEALSAYEDVGQVTTLWRAVAPVR
jgi:hypothetical protein